MKRYSITQHSSCEKAIAVRIYLKKDQENEENSVKKLAEMIDQYNKVCKVETASNKRNPELCRLTFTFQEPVPITSEDILDSLLDCYYNLFEVDWTLVIVTDEKERELTLWDMEDVILVGNQG